jgi:phosphatidate cytidylyltransferase
MSVSWDLEFLGLMAGIVAMLTLSSAAAWVLARRVTGKAGRLVVANLNDRILAWWVMVAVFSAALATGDIDSVALFGLLSFFALWEFITLTPTHRADHRILF